ncbi:MAG: hypothetical protein K8T25_18515, partial [Planctomycetia bacterium]|nr:hypothetical protein [Planctomycetia bacterium]
MIDTQGTLKVLDIGVARLAASGETAATEANPTAGDRLLYLAPEQFQGTPGTQSFDARTDIFSLGCVFYFLLTGKSPFTGGNEAERKKSRGTPPAEIRTRRKDVPQELIDICKKMMGRSPQERYATSADVAAALETWLKQTEGTRMAAQARAAAARPRQEPPARPAQQESDVEQVDVNRARPSDGTPPAEETEPAAEQTGRKKSRSLAKNAPWILAAVGGLVMVLAGIGLTVTVMRSGPVQPPATVAAGTTTGAMTPVVANSATTNGAANGANALDSGEFVFYPLPVDHVEPLPGVTFTPKANGLIVVGGVPPATATYRIAAKIDVSDLLGLRLDVLPFREPGQKRHPGPLIPFRLSEVSAEIAADEKFTHPVALKFARATPDYEEPGFTAAQGIDGDVKTHWAVDKAGKSPHALILWTDKPFGNPTGKPGPYWLRVTLDQQAGGAQTLRLFKLSLVLPSRGEASGPDKPPVGPETPAAKPAPQVLAYWRFDPADAKPKAKPEGTPDDKSNDKPMEEKPPEKPAKEKQLTGKNRPAVEDISGSGNHLYADASDDAPHWSKETAGDAVRATKAPNVRSLDLTEPAAKPNSGHGLRTDSVRSQPAHEMTTAKLDAVTVEASFKLSELGHSHALVGQDGPAKAGVAPLQLRVGGDDDKVQFEVADNKGKTQVIRSSEPVVANRWYHVAAGSDGHRLRMWLDTGDGKGLQPQGEVALPAPMAAGKEAWRVGRGYYKGQPADDATALIDEVRVTAGALEPADMLMFGTPEQLAADKAKADKLATAKAPKTPESAADDKQKFNALDIDEVEAANLKNEKLADVEFKPQPDGSYLVEGDSPPAVIYELHAHTKLTQIAGFRLEAFADQRLPNNGPGRSEVKPGGQFVVTQFAVLASSRAGEVRPKPTEWAKADGDFSQADRPVANLASGTASAGWGIAPQFGKSHWALLTAKQPLGYAGGTWLTIRIAQGFGQKHTLGRFRVMAVTGKSPGEEPGAAVAAADQILSPLSKLPKIVALPDLPADGNAQGAAEATKPIDLGEIFRPPGVPLKVKLRGGESA